MDWLFGDPPPPTTTTTKHSAAFSLLLDPVTSWQLGDHLFTCRPPRCSVDTGHSTTLWLHPSIRTSPATPGPPGHSAPDYSAPSLIDVLLAARHPPSHTTPSRPFGILLTSCLVPWLPCHATRSWPPGTRRAPWVLDAPLATQRPILDITSPPGQVGTKWPGRHRAQSSQYDTPWTGRHRGVGRFKESAE